MFLFYANMMTPSGLKTFPLITSYLRKIPVSDRLIYHKQIDVSGLSVDKFVMFSLKDDLYKHAEMTCFKDYIERDGKKNVPSLYIWFIKSNCSGNGFGADLLRFAKRYSKAIGCNGFFHLSSDVGFLPNRVPHIFYRKQGMNTMNPDINSKLDKFIRKGKDATYKDFPTIDMYYPPIQFEESKLQRLFNNLFGRKK
ncbi:hypothetical protein HDR58_01400 [bacterium]|nr:hypothetical protein [bacterium]